MEKIERIAVFGAGTMGLGIAQTALQNGFEVYLYDVFGEMARKRAGNRPSELVYQEIIRDFKNKLWLALFLAKGSGGKLLYRSKEAVDKALNRIQFFDSSNLESLIFVDFVIEAIFEDPEAKKELYRAINQKLEMSVPIASNTSTIRIGSLSQAVKNPERFLGMHFFNPVPRMQLVELIFSKHTNSETVAWATYLAGALGKTHIIAPDIPGFIVNRVALPMVAATFEVLGRGAVPEEIDRTFLRGEWFDCPYTLEIVKAMASAVSNLVKETGCSLETIDIALQLGLNWPIKASELDQLLSLSPRKLFEQKDRFKFRMGPVMFCDLVGNDVSLDALKSFQRQEPEKHSSVPALLEKMVAEKKFGMKTGVGFYEYGAKVKLNNLGDGYWQITFGDGGGNLLSLSIVRKLGEMLESLKNMKDIKAVFIGADGPVNGANIKEFPLCLHSEEQARKALNEFNELLKTVENFPAPVIDLIRKRAFGGGYELALACDWIIAEKGSIVGLPEVALGIMPGAGGTQRLSRRTDKTLAANLILSSRPQEACEPLVDLVLSEDQMEPELLKSTFERLDKFVNCKLESRRQLKKLPLKEGLWGRLAAFKEVKKIQLGWRMLGNTTPKSFDLAWQAIVNGNKINLDEGLVVEIDAILEAFKTRDADEGIRAFLEKQKPVFTGQ